VQFYSPVVSSSFTSDVVDDDAMILELVRGGAKATGDA
jgi:hypothetical protein